MLSEDYHRFIAGLWPKLPADWLCCGLGLSCFEVTVANSAKSGTVAGNPF